MELIILWAGMAILVAIIASSKGLGGFGWFIYGLLIWPVALIHVLVAQPNKKHVENQMLAGGDMRKCPFCAEMVKSEATVCRYCQRDLPPSPVPPRRADPRRPGAWADPARSPEPAAENWPSRGAGWQKPMPSTTRPCPHCSRAILLEATVCRHCLSSVPAI